MSISYFVKIPVATRWDAYYNTDTMTTYYNLHSEDITVTKEEQAYINGVKTGFTGLEHGIKSQNDEYCEEFSNGLIYGMGMTQEQYNLFCDNLRTKSRKQSLKHNRWLDDNSWGYDSY